MKGHEMIDEQILEQIRPYIVEKLDVSPSKVTMDAHFQNDLGADSLDMVEMVVAFEKKFNINDDEIQEDEIKTVGGVVKVIREKSALEWVRNGRVQCVVKPAPKTVVQDAPMARKFVMVQNFTYDRHTPDYSGRATQINVGVMSEEVRKNFIECIRNCKPIDGNKFHCGFDVYCDDKTGFEVRPNRKQPAVDWNVPDCLNRAGKDEMVIEMRPGKLKETDCVVTRGHDCPVCIASGKCPSPFIRKYIGRVFFPAKYGKQR